MTRAAIRLQCGQHIHIRPHDVFRHSRYPHHVGRDASVTVSGVFPVGELAVICWRDGTSPGVTVYDRDYPIELS